MNLLMKMRVPLTVAVLSAIIGCQSLSRSSEVLRPEPSLLKPCIPKLIELKESMSPDEVDEAIDRNSLALAVELARCNNKLKELSRFFDEVEERLE